MKKLKTILYFLLIPSFLLSGCVEENLDICLPAVTAELTFSYRGDTNDPSLFSSQIDRVTLFVFNHAGEQVATQQIEKASLNAFQGTQLALPAGDYRIICWGNAFNHTELTDCQGYLSGRLHHPHFTQNGMNIPTNDHLYHGCYSISVPEEGLATGDIPFRSAHIEMKVYIRGLFTSRAEVPSLEVRNLMPQYDMEMTDRQAYATCYYPESSYNLTHNAFESLFQVLRFKDNNPVELDIKDSDGNIRTTVNLNDYMTQNGLTVEGTEEAMVPILIEFNDLGVSVTVPDWIGHVVKPE